MDVYKGKTNEYWEIKPMACNEIEQLTNSINLAERQLAKYHNMHIFKEKHNEHAICAEPSDPIKPGVFTCECYLVGYAWYEAGVIIYAFDTIIPSKIKREKEIERTRVPVRKLDEHFPVDFAHEYGKQVNDMILTLVWGCGLVWLVMGLDETLHNPMRN